MVIRRQTWLLLLVLLGVGLAALLYSPSRRRGPEPGGGELTYRSPTQPEHSAAFAAIRMPRGFHRSHDCFEGSEPGGFCAVRVPSIVPSPARLAGWAREMGFTLTVKPREYEKEVACLGDRRSGLRISTCSRVAILDGQLFVVSATAAVLVHGGVAHGTSTTVGHPTKRHGHIRGVQLHFLDAGFPTPEPAR